jgi:hypothetical protein
MSRNYFSGYLRILQGKSRKFPHLANILPKHAEELAAFPIWHNLFVQALDPGLVENHD